MKKHLQSIFTTAAAVAMAGFLCLFTSCDPPDKKPNYSVEIDSPHTSTIITTLTAMSGKFFAYNTTLSGVRLYLMRLSDNKFWDGNSWGGGGSAVLPVTVDIPGRTWAWQGSPGQPSLPAGTDPTTGLLDGYYNIIAIGDFSGGLQARADSVVAVGITASPSSSKIWSWSSNGLGQLGIGGGAGPFTTPVALARTALTDGKDFVAVESGESALVTLALSTEGRLFSWGYDQLGRLGRGTVNPGSPVIPGPVDVSGELAGKKIVAFSAGESHCLAVTADGMVFGFGDNRAGVLGTGSASHSIIASPTASLMTNAADVSCGDAFSMALGLDRRLYSWGANNQGQLGNGNFSNSDTPMAVQGVLASKDVVAVDCGKEHTLALTTEGKVYAFGFGLEGALGDGAATTSNLPVLAGATGAMAGQNIVAVAAGTGYRVETAGGSPVSYYTGHSLALGENGKVYSWGGNFHGELGLGDTTTRNVPFEVGGALAGRKVTRIDAGDGFSIAYTDDNKVFVWGSNSDGKLGGTAIPIGGQVTTPTEADFSTVLTDGSIVLGLAAGVKHGVVLTGRPPLPNPEIEVEAQGVELTDGAPAGINFGSVGQGGSNSIFIRLRNRGSADLTGLSATVSGAGFSGTTVASSLAPNGETGFDVTFNPNVVGAATGTVQISSNDADESPFDITLTGTSTPMGQVDLAFNGNIGFGPMQSLSLQPDGKVLVGASAFTVNGSDVRYVARLNATTGTADSFNPEVSGASSSVLCSAVLPDGKVMIGGIFTHVDGVARNRLARLNSDGTLDPGFDAQITSTGSVFAIALQGDGKLVVSGQFSGIGGGSSPSLARLNPNGTLDTSFVPAGFGGRGVAVQWDGKIVAVGGNGAGAYVVSRLSGVDGSLDPAFTRLTITSSGIPDCLAVQPDGKILVGGLITAVNSVTRKGICRFNSDGSLDTGFNPDVGGTFAQVTSIVVQANGRILISGAFTSVGGQTRNRIAMLLPDGTLDPYFDPNADNVVRGVALQADGKILAAGGFNNIGGEARGKLARLSNDVATQSLRVTSSGMLIEWVRGGASPETHLVTFDVSSDGGANWTPLGQPGRILVGSTVKWIMLNSSVPATGHVRARAYCQGGYYSGSVSILETITAYGTPPDIVVTENSVSLSSGFTRDFGVVATGRGSAVMQLTIQNAGGTTLTGLSGVTITDDVWEPGDHTTQFQLGKPADISLAPGGTTTMTVTYRPRASVTTIDQPGSNARHWAWLRIPSDDPDENPIDIRLTGMGGLPFTTYKEQDNGDSASPDTDDSDGNGQSDLQGYATRTTAASTDGDGTSVDQPTGGSPFAPTANGAPPVGGTFLFHYRRYKLALADIVYQVEWSDTLAENDWHTTGVTEVIDSDDDTIQMITATVPAGTAGRRFVRLKMMRQ